MKPEEVGKKLRDKERGAEGILLGICDLAIRSNIPWVRQPGSFCSQAASDSTELKMTLTSYDGSLPMASSSLSLATNTPARRMFGEKR